MGWAAVFRWYWANEWLIPLQVVQYPPNFHVKATSPTSHFARIIGQLMPNNFVADNFHTKKVCSRLPLTSSEVRFYTETAVLRFLSTL